MSYKVYRGEMRGATFLFSISPTIFSVDHARYFQRSKST